MRSLSQGRTHTLPLPSVPCEPTRAPVHPAPTHRLGDGSCSEVPVRPEAVEAAFIGGAAGPQHWAQVSAPLAGCLPPGEPTPDSKSAPLASTSASRRVGGPRATGCRTAPAEALTLAWGSGFRSAFSGLGLGRPTVLSGLRIFLCTTG